MSYGSLMGVGRILCCMLSPCSARKSFSSMSDSSNPLMPKAVESPYMMRICPVPGMCSRNGCSVIDVFSFSLLLNSSMRKAKMRSVWCSCALIDSVAIALAMVWLALGSVPSQ